MVETTEKILVASSEEVTSEANKIDAAEMQKKQVTVKKPFPKSFLLVCNSSLFQDLFNLT